MAKQDYEEKYTHPELRERIKEEIKASSKGGKEGQWSARKEAAALPLNDYDDLNVGEVENKSQGLSRDDIETLLDYEKNHANRKTLVETLEGRL